MQSQACFSLQCLHSPAILLGPCRSPWVCVSTAQILKLLMEKQGLNFFQKQCSSLEIRCFHYPEKLQEMFVTVCLYIIHKKVPADGTRA